MYVGNVGTGFSTKDKKELVKKFKKFKRKTSPFDEKINLKGRTPNWLTPKLIAEVKFTEWTKTGKLRHTSFKALREDKDSTEIKRQKPLEEKVEEKTPPAETSSGMTSGTTLEIEGNAVPFSNLEKIYWPKSGLKIGRASCREREQMKECVNVEKKK